MGTTAPTHALLTTGSRAWDDELTMRSAFASVLRGWSKDFPFRPVLLSGQCPTGADAMAERLFDTVGFPVWRYPADWEAHGRAAGPTRNQEMVDALVHLRTQCVHVRCIAFLQPCTKPRCPQRGRHQLMPALPGHFSHGTIDCRRRAWLAEIDVLDVLPARETSAT